MKKFTVALCFPDYCANTVTVEGETLDDALQKALVKGNNDGDGWKRCDEAGETFVDAVCEGEGDPWDKDAAIPVPPLYQRTDNALGDALVKAVAFMENERDALREATTVDNGEYMDDDDRQIVEAWTAQIDEARALLSAAGYQLKEG